MSGMDFTDARQHGMPATTDVKPFGPLGPDLTVSPLILVGLPPAALDGPCSSWGRCSVCHSCGRGFSRCPCCSMRRPRSGDGLPQMSVSMGRSPAKLGPDMMICCCVLSRCCARGQSAKHCSPGSKLLAQVTTLRIGLRGSVVASASLAVVLWGFCCMQGCQSHLASCTALSSLRTWHGCSSDAGHRIAALCTFC